MPMILDSPPRSKSTDKTNAMSADPLEIRRREHHEADIVIVGAGILGCAAAVTFARQGRSVILLERSMKEPDRIVGELLQPGGLRALEILGLKDCVEDIDSIPCKGYEVYYYGTNVHIQYPMAFDSKTGQKERPEGRCFHHGRFVQKLRGAALREPNVTVVETTVTELVKDGWTGQVLGVECKTKGEQDYYFGQLTLVADGYGSKFRKTATDERKPSVVSKFYGLELKDCPLPVPHYGHVILSQTAPILLYQIGSGETRALIDVPSNLESAKPENGGVKNHFENVVTQELPECVRPCWKEAIEKGGIRSMPNSFLPPRTNKTPGMLLLGDALNMRHPLTGGGMTVALNDVVLISLMLSPEAVPKLDNTKLVLKQLSSFHWRRKMNCAVINILAMALYSLFAAEDSTLALLQRGCFHYFLLGGECVDGPAGLLSGIITNPTVLVYHFFSVAVYGIWIHLTSEFRKGIVPAIMVTLWFLLGGPLYVIFRAAGVIGGYVVAELRS